MIFLWIFVSLLMFSLIVLIHEYGHYKTAKIFGVQVDEFGLWIPPRAKKLWKNTEWTLFSLNWIPLGGFVKIAGESELYLDYYDAAGKALSQKKLVSLLEKKDAQIFNAKKKIISNAEKKYILEKISSQKSGKNFYEKNIFQKTLILAVGVIMNFLLAFCIFFFLFLGNMKPLGINTFIPSNTPSLLVPSYEEAIESWLLIMNSGALLYPLENSLASQAGIKEWDILMRINWEDFLDIQDLQKRIWDAANRSLKLEILREEQSIFLEITPNNEGKIWSYLAANVSLDENFSYHFWSKEALGAALGETYAQIRLTFSALWILMKNIFIPETPEDRETALEQVAGPIGIVEVITLSLPQGFTLLFSLWALISINLWVFNILPIPALDGWRILLLWLRVAIDYIFWKKSISQKIENFLHIYFFLLLIALSVIIAYNDINKLF
jgi:regulator of sigma E protease